MPSSSFPWRAGLVALVAIATIGCVGDTPPAAASPETAASEADAPSTGAEWIPGARNVAFVVADGTYNSELTAPLDVLHHVRFREVDRPMNVFIVARTTEPVTTFEGLRILPDFAYDSVVLPAIDVLVIPSGVNSMTTDLEDEGLIEFLTETGTTAEFVVSLCDGAFPLAKTGLLDGQHATTFPGDIPAFRDAFPALERVHEDVLWVRDGKFITGAGGARSFEPALYLVDHLYGTEVAKAIGTGLVIDWDPGALAHFVAP